jgi:hypothetical protein
VTGGPHPAGLARLAPSIALRSGLPLAWWRGRPNGKKAYADPEPRRAATLNRLAAADALIVGALAYFDSMAAAVKRLFEDCVTATAPGDRALAPRSVP